MEINIEKIAEFKISDDFSLLYSETFDVWFIEDYSEDGAITTVLDESNGFLLEPDFEYKGVLITESMIQDCKDVLTSEEEK